MLLLSCVGGAHSKEQRRIHSDREAFSPFIDSFINLLNISLPLQRQSGASLKSLAEGNSCTVCVPEYLRLPPQLGSNSSCCGEIPPNLSKQKASYQNDAEVASWVSRKSFRKSFSSFADYYYYYYWRWFKNRQAHFCWTFFVLFSISSSNRREGTFFKWALCIPPKREREKNIWRKHFLPIGQWNDDFLMLERASKSNQISLSLTGGPFGRAHNEQVIGKYWFIDWYHILQILMVNEIRLLTGRPAGWLAGRLADRMPIWLHNKPALSSPAPSLWLGKEKFTLSIVRQQCRAHLFRITRFKDRWAQWLTITGRQKHIARQIDNETEDCLSGTATTSSNLFVSGQQQQCIDWLVARWWSRFDWIDNLIFWLKLHC